jgi:radical SAM superfamily enzyme YgiQ (UPF0313 family)
MAQIAIVNPRFEVSYWGLEHALPLFGKRANLPTACLPLLAALTPEPHQVTLIDENVEDIDFDRLAAFDIVGVTGMSVQRFRAREILDELKLRGVFTVVGGPWVTVYEDYFDGLADVIFVGEADETWPQFLREWQQGLHQPRYEQANSTDMTKVPTPRFDLMKTNHYMFGSLQFTRGCPYQCEFCDIIVIFGRRPRLKTSPQVVNELEALRAEGMEIVFVVDDNLIGNKQAIKLLLRDVIDWQQANGYPLTFFTEASIDLADDEELMKLMVEANFVSVFIGVESPNEESLLETKKFQNVREGGSMIEKIHAIQQVGLDVWCGMILGFDSDDASIFDAQREFLHAARITHVMIGMLYAIPKTPLYDRLEEEGRLDTDDPPDFGTNVIPAQMTRAELRDGYVRVLRELYEPDAYFDRLEQLYLDDEFEFATGRTQYWQRHPLKKAKAQLTNWVRFAYIRRRLARDVPDEFLRAEYARRIKKMLKHRHDPSVWFVYAVKCAMHFHHYTMSQQMAREEMPLVSSM